MIINKYKYVNNKMDYNNMDLNQLYYDKNSFILDNQNQCKKSKYNLKISDRVSNNSQSLIIMETQVISDGLNEGNHNKQNFINIQQHQASQLNSHFFNQQDSIQLNKINSQKLFNMEKIQKFNDYCSSSIYSPQINENCSETSFKKRNFHLFNQLTPKQQITLGNKVISGLQKNIVSLPFRQPVDVITLNIPDYLEIIKQPMDLRTIKKKLSYEQYQSIDQIYRDIQLIIQNSLKYNQFNPDFIRLTKNFEKSYKKIRRHCERNIKKLRIAEEKKSQISQNSDIYDKRTINSQNKCESASEYLIYSSFKFQQLARLAKRIRKLLSEQQIRLFQKIGIFNTLTIDMKNLTTKQIKILMVQIDKIEATKGQMIRNQQKKQNSHITTCQNEFR